MHSQHPPPHHRCCLGVSKAGESKWLNIRIGASEGESKDVAASSRAHEYSVGAFCACEQVSRRTPGPLATHWSGGVTSWPWTGKWGTVVRERKLAGKAEYCGKLRCFNQTSRSLKEQHYGTGDTQGTNTHAGGGGKQNAIAEKRRKIVDLSHPPPRTPDPPSRRALCPSGTQHPPGPAIRTPSWASGRCSGRTARPAWPRGPPAQC